MYKNIISQSGFSMDRLANFCAVADAGSIVGAAKNNTVLQTLISRQIRELEGLFGVELIRRRGRGLELTDEGRELAAVGRENFKGLADYAARCRGAAWTVRMVASNSVAAWLVLPKLKPLEKQSRSVRFEIHHEQTSEMVTALREGIYDIGFVRKDALGPGLEYKVLGEIGHTLLVPKSLAKTAPKNIAAVLGTIPMALPVGGHLRGLVDAMAAKARVQMNVAVGCSSYLQSAQVLQSGMCAAVLPDIALPFLKHTDFHRFPLPNRYTLCLAWSARNAATRPALEELIQHLIKTTAIDTK